MRFEKVTINSIFLRCKVTKNLPTDAKKVSDFGTILVRTSIYMVLPRTGPSIFDQELQQSAPNSPFVQLHRST